ncbi:MAG: FadR family transcriptional regulator [Syntrophales bacterium]|jgi:GntR family transcriptional repressor for pyruvate dehydrogenase complex|nr:FadR family transcriptional regulator [Syntrophales bacterium]MDY0043078.1 FadR/GntR family transcriptional regulator [Syntrophales bacterium]
MSDIFRPIEKESIPGEIVEQILSLIRSRILKPGSRIPPESELSEIFRVGRGSIREAMKILESTGLIRSSNKGKFVRQSSVGDFGIFLLEMNESAIHEVLEVRRMIEVQLAGLAAERATSADIEKMSTSLEEIKDINSMLAGDLGFHMALVAAARNSAASAVYNSVTGSLFKIFKHYPVLLNGKVNLKITFDNLLCEHKEILEAIKSKDPKAAQNAMRIHLDSSEKKVLKALEFKLKAACQDPHARAFHEIIAH